MLCGLREVGCVLRHSQVTRTSRLCDSEVQIGDRSLKITGWVYCYGCVACRMLGDQLGKLKDIINVELT